tara:strand:- start:41492 stop:42031 length:540 start_codon:yes stop_codon:yes gene_type:complete
MARKSSIQQLDPRLRSAVDELIRQGRFTLDDIVAHLAKLNGGEAPVSRSALGRYAQRAEEQMRRYKEAQEVAKVWVNKFENEPDGDVARLLPEMLRSVAFQTLGSIGDREEGADSQEVMFLAKAMKDLASADVLTTQRILKIREETAKKAAVEAVKTAKAQGLSDEAAELIRQKILGVV